MDQIHVDRPGQTRTAILKGELFINVSDLAMAMEVKAYRQYDPDAKEALMNFAAWLFEKARTRG